MKWWESLPALAALITLSCMLIIAVLAVLKRDVPSILPVTLGSAATFLFVTSAARGTTTDAEKAALKAAAKDGKE